MIIQTFTLLAIQQLLVDSRGPIQLNLRRLVLRLFTKWLSDVVLTEFILRIFLPPYLLASGCRDTTPRQN
jgi:hypothetical protein